MSTTPSGPARAADLAYDSFYSAAIGGSVVALFFLALDSLRGDPLFTPSLLGSVIVGGMDAEAVSTVRLDMVAYYSILHFGVFALLGFGLSILLDRLDVAARKASVSALVCGLVVEVVGTAGLLLVAPAAVDRIGLGWVVLANALTGVAMGVFLARAHEPGTRAVENQVPVAGAGGV